MGYNYHPQRGIYCKLYNISMKSIKMDYNSLKKWIKKSKIIQKSWLKGILKEEINH